MDRRIALSISMCVEPDSTMVPCGNGTSFFHARHKFAIRNTYLRIRWSQEAKREGGGQEGD